LDVRRRAYKISLCSGYDSLGAVYEEEIATESFETCRSITTKGELFLSEDADPSLDLSVPSPRPPHATRPSEWAGVLGESPRGCLIGLNKEFILFQHEVQIDYTVPVSTAMYAIEGGFDKEELLSDLPDAELERRSDAAEGPLRTRFREVSETTNGVSCVIQFEVEAKRPTWDGVVHERERNQARIRFTDSVGDGVVFIIAKRDHQNLIASRLLDFFGLGPDPSSDDETDSMGIVRIEISESALHRIVDDDANVETRASYKSIDDSTESAALSGVLNDSDAADRFNDTGTKRWVIFDSTSYERTIGITSKNDAVVFWGDWNDDEMERYWIRIVIPQLSQE